MAAYVSSQERTGRRWRLPVRSSEAIALAVILAGSALLNLWNLSSNGWANAFYTAAVQSGLHDGESFLFGASDWGNSISVDKPPLSLWLMGLSVRVFGFNAWGLLLPQALLGVATTALIFVVVRRRASGAAALVAAAAFATTPIVVLLSRYNNPDPLLIFLMVLALEVTLRGLETKRIRWFAVAGVLLGLGFLTKQLQVLLIAPALGLAALFGLRLGWRKTLAAGGAVAGSFVGVAGGWLAFVDRTPAGNRPYVGSSMTNSLTELTLGYNGLQRVINTDAMTSDDNVTHLIPQRYVGSGDDAGLLRMLNGNYNQEASWLLPLGLVCALLVVWALRRTRAASLAVASAVWLMTSYLLLSFMGNDIHTYYTMNLAAPLALAVGLGVEALRSRPLSPLPRRAVALGVGLSAVTGWLTLASLDAGNVPGDLAWAVLGLGLLGAVLLAVPSPVVWGHRLAAGFVITSLLIGPLTTNIATLGRTQAGSNPISGSLTKNPNTMSHFLAALSRGNPQWASDISRGASPPHDLVQKIDGTSTSCRWSVATYVAQTAANWQIALDRPVMPIGGFSASDPSPTLAQFQKLVADKSICYFVDYPELDPVVMNQPAAGPIIAWVRSQFSSTVANGVVVFDLRNPTAP
ncbi:ArnT family glycosyltransferase [Sinomonas sp. G460-2]|uniref:ArnT family glycosyltransferase n=1 Tax=Sinomonas sp. G460-2 TaxID=3393464 RepID=UPI0039EF81B6